MRAKGSATYAPVYRMLLLGASPAACASVGMDKAVIRKLVVFKANQGKNMTLAALSNKTGLTLKTCWNLKQIHSEYKIRGVL